jgi:hypothetical protein
MFELGVLAAGSCGVATTMTPEEERRWCYLIMPATDVSEATDNPTMVSLV